MAITTTHFTAYPLICQISATVPVLSQSITGISIEFIQQPQIRSRDLGFLAWNLSLAAFFAPSVAELACFLFWRKSIGLSWRSFPALSDSCMSQSEHGLNAVHIIIYIFLLLPVFAVVSVLNNTARAGGSISCSSRTCYCLLQRTQNRLSKLRIVCRVSSCGQRPWSHGEENI